MEAGEYVAVKNSTLLFFVEKLVEKPRSLHDLSCQFGSKGFTRQMRQIAGNSQAGLKRFLSQHPALFTLHGDVVYYSDLAPPPADSATLHASAVAYFRSRLIQYGLNVHVPIKSLLGHRSQAPSEVRHVSGQHLTEFREFLDRHPTVFSLKGDFVLLKEFEDEGKVIYHEEETAVCVDKSLVFRLVSFIGECIRVKGPLFVDQLFHAVISKFEEDSLFINSPSDLSCFIRMNERCFKLAQNLVSLSDTFPVGIEHLKIEAERAEDEKIIMRISSRDISIKAPMASNETRSSIRSTSSITSQGTDKEISDKSSESLLSKLSRQTSDPEVPLSRNVNNNLIRDSEPVDTSESILHHSASHENNKEGRNGEGTDSCSKKRIEDEAKRRDGSTLKSRLNKVLLSTLSKNNSSPNIISNVNKARGILENVKKNAKEVGCDCEGVNLGQDGTLTLVQLATSNSYYIFDLLAEPSISHDLKAIFEDENIVKVMHDCRNDSVNLFNQFGIRLNNVFDTQVAHALLDPEWKNKNVSLNHLCGKYGLELNPYKEKMKGAYRHDQRFWQRRPLTSQMIAYALFDVKCLLPIYDKMREVEENENFSLLCMEHVLTHISPEEIRNRRRLRKNAADLSELKKKLQDGTNLVLSNREMRLLRHMELSESEKELLKSSLKVARKLEKMEGRGEGFLPNCGSSSTSDSNFNSIEFDFFGVPPKWERATQTHSTGDIVILAIHDEE